MGLPMGRALADAGVRTRGFDVRTGDDFPGLDMEFDAARVMQGATHLISVVRDQAETETLLFGPNGLLQSGAALRFVVICSTLPPGYIMDLAQRLPSDICLVDAPMSGAQVAAEEKRLTFMYGCELGLEDELALFLAPMGQQFHHMGDLGRGMLTKVLNNLVAASSVVSTRLALDWAKDWDLDKTRLLNTMHDSSGQTWFGSNFEAIEFARDGFADDNSIGVLRKDVACALTCAPDGTHALGTILQDSLKALRDFDDK